MIFIDSNIFMYAAGKQSPQKGPCAKFLSKLVSSGNANEFYTNSEVLQELLHRYRSLGMSDTAFTLVDFILRLGVLVLPVEVEDIMLARKFLEKLPSLPTRDGIHAAVALRHGIPVIASYDKDFDKIPELRRIQP